MECCGRPQIAKGLLPEAKELARRNVAHLKRLVDRGLPILGCEPSCLVTLKDEYPDLVPGPDARAVADASELVEAFLAREMTAGDEEVKRRRGEEVSDGPPVTSSPPHLFTSSAAPFYPRPGRALLHGHCHQKALLGTRATLDALRLIPGLQVSEIPSGCCGMAGSFGYEAEHYEVSLKIGEETLFRTIREASPEVLLVAPGTSCRDQIHHATGRVARHPVEVLAEALEPMEESEGAREKEQAVRTTSGRAQRDLVLRLLVGGAIGGAAVVLTASALSRSRRRCDAQEDSGRPSDH
jgi:Fe-S oxidoreductase